MKLYRFSPITTESGLIKAITHIHNSCHRLCMKALGEYLPAEGNVGVFCHYQHEFEYLKEVQNQLIRTEEAGKKYPHVIEPIGIVGEGNIPDFSYPRLYIRQPDPYRYQVGDIDFIVSKDRYAELKQKVASGELQHAIRLFPRDDLDMLELYDPDEDALGYIVPEN